MLRETPLLGIRITKISSTEWCPGGANCKILILCNSVTSCTIVCSVLTNNKWKSFVAIAHSKDKQRMVVVSQMRVYHWFHFHTDRNDGTGENPPEDSTTSVEGYAPHFPDSEGYRTTTPVTPANTGSPEVTEVTVVGNSNSDVDGSLPGNLPICYLVCFLYVEKQQIFSCYRGYFLCGPWLDWFVTWEWLVSCHHFRASKLRLILCIECFHLPV